MLADVLASDPLLEDLRRRLGGTARPLAVSGLWGSSAPMLAGLAAMGAGQTLLYVTAHADQADEAAEDIATFTGSRPEVLPAWELRPGEGPAADEIAAERTRLCNALRDLPPPFKGGGGGGSPLQPVPSAQCPVPSTKRRNVETSKSGNLASRRADTARLANPQSAIRNPQFLTASIQALMQPVPTAAALDRNAFVLRPGQTHDPLKLCEWLVAHDFNRLDQVERPGDFALRGGILDIYLSTAVDPIRVEFFGDEIESIRRFDPLTQRSSQPLPEARIALPPRAADATPDDTTSFINYLPPETIIALHEPADVQEMGRTLLDRLGNPVGMFPVDAVFRGVAARRAIYVSRFESGFADATDTLPVRTDALPPFDPKGADAVGQLLALARDHAVTVFCDNEGERQRLEELIAQDGQETSQRQNVETSKQEKGPRGQGVEGPRGKLRNDDDIKPGTGHWALGTPSFNPQSAIRNPQLTLTLGLIRTGFTWRGEASTHTFLAHHELFHRLQRPRRMRAVAAARPIESFLDLEEGDHVVHATHGIARFIGMKTLRKGDRGKQEEFLALQYSGDAVLHVPASQIELVQKYVGPGSARPALSVLGGTRWKAAKASVEEAVTDFATELLRVQAEREAREGIAYPDDTAWQREFEAAFLFTETRDQTTASGDIKRDMIRTRPMDRLLCGDVGYGKTELAMRAAFKAVEYGKQVAVLVPTTVLAEQHHETFRQRMGDYPFVVERLSRFRSHKEQADIISRTRKGQVDILIGTHRLLSKDVHFADLGLVVIDEEQRFGVEHKERLKHFRATVDVLTLTATPIPRTLHMAMVGLRDISALESPPLDRRSITTQVTHWNDKLIREAVLRELNRDGQVFFVHNRVHSIDAVSARIGRIVPEARRLVGHGQMHGDDLEDVMLRFIAREADILVCTTIIESGIDIPTANTILIDQADMFGLADLHQLRGRVGRYKHRAYCYMLLSPDRPITSTAARRLKAIEEFSELGSGFRISMRDLEIRGAGNILGAEQSGHIALVGYEMYCRLLEQAVQRMKGQTPAPAPDVHLELDLEAYVPKSYIASERQRMDIYRRISACRTVADVEQLEHDLQDAFGKPPPLVDTLLALADLRVRAIPWKIRVIQKKEPDFIFKVDDLRMAEKMFKGSAGSIRIPDGQTLHWRVPESYFSPATMLAILRRLLSKPN